MYKKEAVFLGKVLEYSPLSLSAIITPVFASLRQPLSGAYRPLPSVEPGVPAASMFCEHLADADDAALKRLVHIVLH